jgi:hypothetical protein
MTGYTVHTGSTEKFAAGWDQIFQTGSAAKSAAKSSGKSTAKKAAAPKKKVRPKAARKK